MNVFLTVLNLAAESESEGGLFFNIKQFALSGTIHGYKAEVGLKNA